MPRKLDVKPGDTFNYFTVVRETEPYRYTSKGEEKLQRQFLLRCVCGEERVYPLNRFYYDKGSVKSCGCVLHVTRKRRENEHGMSKTPEHKAWLKIKGRCLNPNDNCYKRYGARGITICEEWVDDFMSFYNYIGDRPSKDHSVDRLDNSKGYEPGNVRWATKAEQARNKGMQKNNKTGVKGVSWEDKLHPNGKSTLYAIAQWKTINGGPRKKCFSVKRFGKEEAFKLACEYRKEQMQLLNEEGAGYTEDHISNTKRNNP